MKKSGKHLDFELNLIPFIDLLSVCICFLLLTAVWLHIGTLNVKQAVGGQSVAETEKKPLVWLLLGDAGKVQINVQDSSLVPANLRSLALSGRDGQVDLEGLGRAIAQLKTVEPKLATALIQPKAATAFEEIIGLMDEAKKSGLVDLGVAPL